MKIVRNDKMIERYGRIGAILSIVAIAGMGYGFYLSVKKPEYINTSIVLLILGFILTQVSLYIGNRWGRSPRPDEILDQSLKGLGKKYTIYHYTSPVGHLLVGPAGLWVLLPYYQRGTISYDEKRKRWKQKNDGFGHAYMRLFGQEGLGRPELDAEGEILRLQKEFKKAGLDTDELPIHAALVFTSKLVKMGDVSKAPYPAMKAEDLKRFVLDAAKEVAFPAEEAAKINALLTEGED